MKRSMRLPILVLAMLAVAATFARAEADGLALRPGSKLWLAGSSTIHSFTAKASRLSVGFEHDPARWPADANGGDAVEHLIRAHGVTSMDVVVGVTGLESGKDGLDRNMHKALKADKHPSIRFKMTSYEIGETSVPTESTLEAKGSLTVAGVERAIAVKATAKREGETVRLRGSAPLLMSQFGIKPPTMMMGTLRTADEVVIHFDLVVGTKDSASVVSNAR